MLNRSVPPLFQPIKDLSLIAPTEINYANGLKTFAFQAPNLDLIKFEFVFENVYEENHLPLHNSILSAMLKEGTKNRTSAEIAAQIDYYGAFLMPEFSFDYTALTVYTMHKYVANVLPIVADILQEVTIPQQELDTHIRNNKQNLQISLQKNDVLARRKFYQEVFGSNRYGIVPTESMYDLISREELLALYDAQIQPSNCTLLVAGNVDSDVLATIEKHFGSAWENKKVKPDSTWSPIEKVDGKLLIESREDALQSAIRMGNLTIGRAHADFPAIQFVNTLFGGFFGSRLMKNIREDKGYTYSIGSAVGNLKHTGFFTLASEVGVDVTKDALTEIEKEFRVLQQEKASAEEVDLVRNYMQGVLLGSLESIFSHADKFKSVYFSGLDYSYYHYYNEVVSEMTADKVQDIAQRYFNYNELIKVVVGKVEG